MVKMWLGAVPQKCDIGGEPITDTFVDGATKSGPWANMCPKCAKTHGRGIGVGKGQLYQKNDAGKFVKIKG